jgi:uncharacterized protein YndB with AHSA1/START domain/DNA-binding transcriptional ArsR family regulator
MDDVFKALADPSRRLLLDSLNARNGQTLRELCAGLDMARQSVSKHLAVLEAANLVSTAWHGREKLHYLNAVPINDIAERWINRYDQERARALTDLKTALESSPVASTASNTEFVYTIYINTTPDKLWQALTDPAFTRRYWGVEFDTDWQVGSTMTWDELGVRIADPEQVVLAAEPNRRLSYTWHTFTPEKLAVIGVNEDDSAKIGAEGRSTVTFDIEQQDDAVKLTVTHSGFAPGSTVLAMIGSGWPALLSNLKTLLETGEVMLDRTS